MMSRTFILAALVLCLGTASVFAEEGAVSQFLVDPTNPDRGFVLTDTSLQFNAALKTGGRWTVKFDREKFRSLTGESAVAGYRHRKVQTSRTRRGALFLLVDNGGANQRYIFMSADNGDSWKVMRAPGRRGPEPSTNAAISPPAGKPVQVKQSEEESVDLGALDSAPSAPSSSGSGRPNQETASVQAPSASAPLFKFMFDFLLVNRPGISPLTFDNYHSLSLVDIIPRPEIQFSFELAPQQRFYELLYKMNEKLEFRIGRIWIPFDQMNPHNTFGGFWNTSFTRPPDGVAFLPDVWTDLGIAMKYVLVDTPNLAAETEFYVVNGFGAGGNDPANEVGTKYPSFTGAPSRDNNADKAFGARAKVTLDGSYEFGTSVYTGRYTNDADPAKRLTMLGFDARLRLTPKIEARGGYAYMMAELPVPSSVPEFKRAGLYGEVTLKLDRRWRLTLLGGQTQNDDRVLAVGDQKVIGGRIGYTLGFMSLYFIMNADLLDVEGKTKSTYTALRAMLLL